MEDVAQLWVEGGWGMYPLFLLFLLGLGIGTALPLWALTGKPSPRSLLLAGGLSLVLGLMTFAAGWGFELLGLQRMNEALALVSPADAELIRAAGTSEAMVTRMFGLIAALLPLAAGALTLVMGVSPKRRLEGIVVAALVLAGGGMLLVNFQEERARHHAAAFAP